MNSAMSLNVEKFQIIFSQIFETCNQLASNKKRDRFWIEG
jgi:hypothetical protein